MLRVGRLSLPLAACVAMLLCLVATTVRAGTVTYEFDNTLAANEAGAPSLNAVDPLAQNGFETDTVFGHTRTVYRWDGNASPISEQAGLTLDTSSFISDPTSYSLELVFQFTEDTGTWRRIFDTTGRLADTGFYVEPGDRLQVYNDVTGSTIFQTNEYHYIVMTVHNNSVKAYFDGSLELNSPTDKLNIVDPLVSFFVDNNLGGPAQTEFADGRVAFLRMSSLVLSDEDIARLANDPFTEAPPAPIPLPAAAWLFAPGAAVAMLLSRRWRGAPRS